MEYYKTELDTLKEDHLISVHHTDDTIVEEVKNAENNKRFILIDKIDEYTFFEVVGYKKDNEIFIHRCSIANEERTPVEIFCSLYKIELEEDFAWIRDEKFNCDIIIQDKEIVSEKLIII